MLNEVIQESVMMTETDRLILEGLDLLMQAHGRNKDMQNWEIEVRAKLSRNESLDPEVRSAILRSRPHIRD